MAISLIAGSGIAATAAGAAEFGILDRPADRLGHSIENHKRQKQRLAKKRERRREARYASLPGGVSRSTLEAIAACESGGDPAAVDASGTYRGKYQFDSGTWASVGGSGDPAAAPEAEQDYRAAVLYSRSGSSPWPVCG
jgi:soluble lytic murein transglycosylase-like protein